MTISIVHKGIIPQNFGNKKTEPIVGLARFKIRYLSLGNYFLAGAIGAATGALGATVPVATGAAALAAEAKIAAATINESFFICLIYLIFLLQSFLAVSFEIKYFLSWQLLISLFLIINPQKAAAK